ncbi:MAG: carbohydrate ABC transporter permease [Oscillospiraceae bacterium]
MKQAVQTRRTRKKLVDNDTFVGYAFIAPWLIGFLFLTIIPMLISLYLSFTRYNLTSPPQWIGAKNFIDMFTNDPRYFKSIRATLYFVLFSVPLKLIFALLVAFLLNHKAKAYNIYRSVYYLPSLIGGSIAVSMVWKELFATKGVINSLLQSLGYTGTIRWLGDTGTAIWTLILLSVWQFGSSMIIFAAGLKQIPVSYYEAAKIDGASTWAMFCKITLPCLSPVIMFNLIMQLISGFMSFTQSFVITVGGPLDSTLFYALYVYQKSFSYMDMGYACAMSWVLLLIIGVVTGIVFRTSDRWVFYESKG